MGPWFAPIDLPIWARQQRLYLLALIRFVVSAAINYYADQTTQIVLFVVQLALFGLLANRVHRRLAAVHDWVRRLLGRGLDQQTGRSELRVEMEIWLYRDRSSLREAADDFWAAACASAA